MKALYICDATDIENMSRYSRKYGFGLEIQAFYDPELVLCLDVGYVNCHSDASIDDWIKTCGSLIGYVHLHNNDGTSDRHRGLDRGTLDMARVCEALNEYAPDAIRAVEAEPEYMESSLDWLDKKKIVSL